MNNEYVVASTRFSVPIRRTGTCRSRSTNSTSKARSALSAWAERAGRDGTSLFRSWCPGYNYDLSHSGKGKSHGWMLLHFATTPKRRTRCSKSTRHEKDKDFIARGQLPKLRRAVHRRRRKAKDDAGEATSHNRMDEATQYGGSRRRPSTSVRVKVLDPKDCSGLDLLPADAEVAARSGRRPDRCSTSPRAASLPPSSRSTPSRRCWPRSKLRTFEEVEIDGIPVLKYDVRHGRRSGELPASDRYTPSSTVKRLRLHLRLHFVGES